MPNYEAAFYDLGARYDTSNTGNNKQKGRHMASNRVPSTLDDLLYLAEEMADGCHLHEVAIGLQHNMETDVRASIAALRTTEAAFGAAKTDRQAALDAAQAADEDATDFLLAAKRVLSQFLGTRWSAAWEATGFPDLSTAVPKTVEKRMNLCGALKIYFTNNPTREVAALGVTAALAETKFQAISDGRTAVTSKEELQTAAKQARDVALQGLRKRAHDLITELDTLLGDDDARWHAFGLSMPSDPDTPEPVTSVALSIGAAGVIVASWPRAVRATRYRPYTQIVGVDPEPVAHDPVHDLFVNLPGFASGQTVKVYIIAANDAGEALPGPTEEILIP
jgi:hypothetical protein